MIDLRPDDGHAVFVNIESISDTAATAIGTDAAGASWALTLAMLDSLRRQGRPHPGEEAILRQLRQQLRNVLLREAERPVSRWVLPATPDHLTAAYLVTLMLTRRGEGVGLWPWPHPTPGPALIIGGGWSRLIPPLPTDIE